MLDQCRIPTDPDTIRLLRVPISGVIQFWTECDTANPPDSDDECLDYNVELLPTDPGYNADCAGQSGCDTNSDWSATLQIHRL